MNNLNSYLYVTKTRSLGNTNTNTEKASNEEFPSFDGNISHNTSKRSEGEIISKRAKTNKKFNLPMKSSPTLNTKVTAHALDLFTKKPISNNELSYYKPTITAPSMTNSSNITPSFKLTEFDSSVDFNITPRGPNILITNRNIIENNSTSIGNSLNIGNKGSIKNNPYPLVEFVGRLKDLSEINSKLIL
jgi:hypothetical protein